MSTPTSGQDKLAHLLLMREIEDFLYREADLLDDVVEFVLAVVLFLQPLGVVIGEHQFHDVLAQPLHALAVGGDVHALAHGRVAAGHHLGSIIFL